MNRAPTIQEIITELTEIFTAALPDAHVKDLDQVPDSATAICPVLYPDQFTGADAATRDTFGEPPTHASTKVISIRYTLCYAPVGQGTGQKVIVPLNWDMADRVINVVMENDKNNTLWDDLVITQFGNGFDYVSDLTGGAFYGFTFTVTITKYL